MSIEAKLDKDPPYKLLACDGGGIRGIISIEILAKIESELRASSGKPDLVLADYFDYVAGTSTGAIIATLVALGFSVDDMRKFYLESGAEMFERRPGGNAGSLSFATAASRKCFSAFSAKGPARLSRCWPLKSCAPC